jgi:hypothetical protein
MKTAELASPTAISLFQSVIAVCSSAAACLWTKGLSYRRNVLGRDAAGTHGKHGSKIETAIKKYYE